jgi:hypothetical protein
VATDDTEDVPPQRGRAMTMDLEIDSATRGAMAQALPFRAPPETAATEATPATEGPWSETDPVFEIASMDTVETPPHGEDGAATPFHSSDESPTDAETQSRDGDE